MTATDAPVNLAAVAADLTETWSPRVVGSVNDLLVKVGKVEGEFVWHDHPETDEFFLVLSGALTIRLPDREVSLQPGDCFVVPRGVRHCPVAATGTTIALLEPAGVVNTGAAGGTLTAPVDQPLPE